MKIFIWTDYCPDWTGGLAFALAEDETQARALIEKEHGSEPYHWGNLEVRELNEPVARQVSGGS